jgi:serine/threonine protein kinase
MQTVNHPFIVRFFDVSQNDDDVFIAMEYVSHGTMLELLNRGTLPLSDVLRFFAQLVSALLYLHNDLNYVHRDIKLENILLDEYQNVRLVDFGFSKQLDDKCGKTTTVCGSLPYCAPEVFQQVPYGKAVDIWSLGVCLYGMVVGKLPFEPAGFGEIGANDEPEIPPGIPAPIADLLTRMLRKNPEQRMTIEEIVRHPWIKTSVWTIYFERGFRDMAVRPEGTVPLPALRRPAVLRSLEGEDDTLAGKVMARRQRSRIAANPELFVMGSMRNGRSLPDLLALGSQLPLAPQPEVAPLEVGRRHSLLEGMQGQTGILTRRVGGVGRIALRPARRAAARMMANPALGGSRDWSVD